MTEHVESDQLDESLRYRFEYLSKFINFTNEDIASLNTLATVALPLIPVIVDAVYRKLFQFDVTKDFFILRNDGFGGQLKKGESFTLDSAQMTYRRDMLSGYLKRLLLQREWTDEFLEYLSKIGRLHSNKIGSKSLYVDYVHINATLCYIETLLIDAVWNLDNLENMIKRDILVALNKVFRIQNDLFIFHYIEKPKIDDKSTSLSHHKTDKCVCS